jgi:two-component system response regulator HydG
MSPINKIETILVVDDAVDTLEVISRNLIASGYRVLTVTSVTEALGVLDETSIDLVITDLKMPKTSGLDLVRHVRENLKDTEVMMITGYASIEGAIQALHSGAEEYLTKPFTDEELSAAVKRTMDKLHLRRAGSAPASDVKGQRYAGLLGNSEPMKQVFGAIAKASQSLATVLLTGESGTGKELVARAIHYASPRASSPFVPINCAAIPSELVESELFGHIKGAFTGAIDSRAGFFQTADGGTIFLDEISETTPALQAKLLRVLEDKEVTMVGDTRSRKVDVRILTATNKDLYGLVKKGLFREDLFFRLSVITMVIPPLKDRGDDMLFLVGHFANKFARELDKPAPQFTKEALQALRNYAWPGNVRELENLIQRLIVMLDTEQIDISDLPSHMRFAAPRESGLNRTLAEVEIDYIRKVLENVGGNKSRASEILGIDRKTLREKLKDLDLPQ